MLNHQKLTHICFLIMGLCLTSACGGGSDAPTSAPSTGTTTPPANSGGGITPPPPPPTPMSISVGKQAFNLDEEQSMEFTISVSDADGSIAAEIDNNSDLTISTSINGSTITVDVHAGILEQDVVDSFAITVSDGDDSQTVEFTVDVNNASADRAIARMEMHKELITDYTYYDEMNVITDALLKIAEFKGAVTRDEAFALNETIKTKVRQNQYIDNLEEFQAESIERTIASFKAGEMTEENFLLSIDSLDDAISNLSTNAAKSLVALFSLFDIPFDEASYAFVSTPTTASGFIGNHRMGEWVDDEWVFSEQYALIGKTLQAPCAEQ